MSTRRKTEQTQTDRIVAALTAKKSPLRERGLTALVDTVLSQPVQAFVDVDRLVAAVPTASSGPNTARTIELHARPAWERYVERCAANGETVGDAVPPEVRRRVARLLTTQRPPAAAWTRDLVDPKLIRQLLAPVLQQMLLSFAKGLPLPGLGAPMGGAGGGDGLRSGLGIRDRLKATVEKRAERVVEAGRTVLGGLGAEVERQVQNAARDFSESASREAKAALEDRLRSDEGKRLLSQIVSQALDGLWRTPLSELNRDVDALPWDDLWGLVPLVSEHNRERGPVLDAIRDELEATLAVVGARTVRDLLDEAGLLEPTLEGVLALGDPIARDLFGGDAFRGWLDELLAL